MMYLTFSMNTWSMQRTLLGRGLPRRLVATVSNMLAAPL
jgi:hypothetical protein